MVRMGTGRPFPQNIIAFSKGFELSNAAACRLTHFAGMKLTEYRRSGRGGYAPALPGRVEALFAMIVRLATHVAPQEMEMGREA